MRVLRSGILGSLLAAMLLMAGPAAAQQGTLVGRVTDVETGNPVDGAQIQVLGGAADTGVLSSGDGAYRIQLASGTYSLVVQFIGYRTDRFDGIRVVTGQTTSFDIQLTSTAVALNELVVTASRGRPEKQVEAPATTHLVGTMEIQERAVATPAEHLRAAPGVDIITHGLQATNVAVRGFNNIFSGSLHALTDHRLAGVPSLRVNLLHFIPSNNEDIDRMEVVLGPGSALYGPNTATGVLHILTRSPLDSTNEGTTVTLGGGERSVFQGSFRTSHLINRNLGFKLSGQYIQGEEWEYTDLGENAARDAADANPAQCEANLMLRGYDPTGAKNGCRRVGVRDFDLERYGLEARADYRFAPDGTVILTYGRTSASGIELTGLGAGQTEDWIYQFYQARMNKGRFFAQAYYNTSNAGNSFLLRDGVPLVDESTLFVTQAQHGFSLMDDRQDFTYGFDYYATRPETNGTINGTYDTEDDMNEWGVYLQSKTAISPKLDLVLAGRLDDHSLLPEKVFSPRAALVFKPKEDQSLRLTYNRAFSTPSSLNFFLDISAGAAPNAQLAALGYTLRAFGTGSDGYSFQNPDGSLIGVRSPFNPAQYGGATQMLPGNSATLWQLALGVLQQQIALGALPAQLMDLVPTLAGLTPSDTDVRMMLLNASTNALTPLDETVIPDVPGIRESYTETFEVGWQGIIANKFRIAADVYRTRKNDFISPLLLQNPLVLLNGEDVGAFITVPIVTYITGELIKAGLDPTTAQQQAQGQAAVIVPQIAAGVGAVPLGVAASDGIPSQGADLIVTYRNVGDIDLWGADLAFSWFLDDRWTLNGSYSHVSDDWFEVTNDAGEKQAPLSLNAPKDKGTLGLAFRDAALGFNADARVRFSTEFPAESAGYVGTKCIEDHDGGLFEEDCVEGAALVDLTVGYKVPNTQATLQLAVTNLFDHDYRSFVGVPYIGRFAMLRVKYDLF